MSRSGCGGEWTVLPNTLHRAIKGRYKARVMVTNATRDITEVQHQIMIDEICAGASHRLMMAQMNTNDRYI